MPRRTLPSEIEREAGDRLGVLELGHPDRRAAEEHDLDVLVRLGRRLAVLDALGEEDVHVLAREPGRRPEAAEPRPRAAGQAALLLQLALRRRERLLAGLARAGRYLQQMTARRLARLAHERDLALPVDGDDRDRARMFDHLALVVAPLLDGDRDELALPGELRRVRLHERSRSARA